MYIESLIYGSCNLEKVSDCAFLNLLSQKYITYAQAGGAYAHKYAKLLDELEISTLILTDLDYYPKSCLDKNIISTLETTNAAIKFFCEREKHQAPDIKLTIADIYKWQASCCKKTNILVKTQTEIDGYARTLEEAILYKFIKDHYNDLIENNVESKEEFSVFTQLTRKKWDDIKSKSGFSLVIPNRTKEEIEQNIPVDAIERCIREIVASMSSSKSDFMYSIILTGKPHLVIPTYIKEGLEWLTLR